MKRSAKGIRKTFSRKTIVAILVMVSLAGIGVFILGANSSDESGSRSIKNPNPVLANMLPSAFYLWESSFDYKDVPGRGIYEAFKDKKVRKISLLTEAWSNVSPEEQKRLSKAFRELQDQYGDASARGEGRQFNMKAKSDALERKLKPEGRQVITLWIWMTDSYEGALMIARDFIENASSAGYMDPKTKKFKKFMPSPGSFSGHPIGNLCWTDKRTDPLYLPQYNPTSRSFGQGSLEFYLVKNNVFARIIVSHTPDTDYLVDPAFVEEVAKKVASKF